MTMFIFAMIIMFLFAMIIAQIISGICGISRRLFLK